jgi:phosphoribosylanthranilate isomerase
MAIDVKICGLKTEAAVAAAAADGAAYVGFVFYPASPRAISPSRAAELGRDLSRIVVRCGLFVDADLVTITETVARANLGVVQLHGAETPSQAAEIRARTGVRVMKALGIAKPSDLDHAGVWANAVDMLLLDAKPPARPAALPGGNGVPFDWRLLQGFELPMPWMLSGGLTEANLAAAVACTGAGSVDVSSGVETAPGVKDPALIREFLQRARSIERPARR